MENMENTKEVSIDELTNELFSTYPKDPCTISLIPYSETYDTDECSFIFEMLLNIYMKGIMTFPKLCELLKINSTIDDDNLDNINYIYSISKQHLEIVEKWFLSIGYILIISEYDDSYNIQDCDYCKILLKNDPLSFFFVLNSNYKKINKLEDIHAIFYKPKKEESDKTKIFSISFSKCLLNSKNINYNYII